MDSPMTCLQLLCTFLFAYVSFALICKLVLRVCHFQWNVLEKIHYQNSLEKASLLFSHRHDSGVMIQIDRISCSEASNKKSVQRNFVKLERKQLQWSPYWVRLQASIVDVFLFFRQLFCIEVYSEAGKLYSLVSLPYR